MRRGAANGGGVVVTMVCDRLPRLAHRCSQSTPSHGEGDLNRIPDNNHKSRAVSILHLLENVIK